MRNNSVKTNLQDGGIAIGTMVFEFKTNGIGRIASNAGADFAIFDCEHTGWDWETIGSLVATSRSADLVPMVRIPTTERSYISRPLDLGAMGLMAPLVETGEQAESLVHWSKYPPAGVRGAAFGVAHDDYLAGDNLAKMRSADDEALLIAQIESADGVKNLADIAAVDGIDVLWVGQFDLTISMGIPGQFDNPQYLEVLDKVAAAASQNNKAAGFMVSSVDEARAMIDRGYRCLAYSGDLWIYGSALKAALDELRPASGEPN